MLIRINMLSAAGMLPGLGDDFSHSSLDKALIKCLINDGGIRAVLMCRVYF